jgi:hypothetical protein
MADSNPFEHSFDPPLKSSTPRKPMTTDSARSPADKYTSMDQIAKILLAENFILTALELHTELMESGQQVKRLSDYFSNPVNFESVSNAAPSSKRFGLIL